MPNLFTLLTAKYVEEHRAGVSPVDSDAALQWMELQMEGGDQSRADVERYLLESYLGLQNEELQALPAGVHEWFLERWAIAGAGTDEPGRVAEIADRIAGLYLIAGAGPHQTAAVAALLGLPGAPVVRIWERVMESGAPEELRRTMVEPLVEALLDFAFMGVEPGVVFGVLGEMVRRDGERGYAAALIRARVEVVGEVAGARLIAILL